LEFPRTGGLGSESKRLEAERLRTWRRRGAAKQRRKKEGRRGRIRKRKEDIGGLALRCLGSSAGSYSL